MAWLFKSERSADAAGLLRLLEEREAVVPSLWHLEVANALLVAERRREWPPRKVAEFLADLAGLPIYTDETLPPANEAHALGRRFGLTAYDAAYLALAARERLPLATFDTALVRAAQKAGVQTLH